MSECQRVPTSKEVYWAIRNNHLDRMVVFTSFSDPTGGFMGGSGEGRMDTEWGFRGQDFATVGTRTTWEIHAQFPDERIDEKNIYWLCVGINDDI